MDSGVVWTASIKVTKGLSPHWMEPFKRADSVSKGQAQGISLMI